MGRVGRRHAGHLHLAQGRQVPRRLGIRRGLSQVEHRPLPNHRTGPARKGELAPVASVDVVDASTVRFNLTTPFSPLLSLLVDRAGMMVSQKVVEAAGQDFTRKAFKAGTGPFVLTEAVKDDHITLEEKPCLVGKDSSGKRASIAGQDHHQTNYR